LGGVKEVLNWMTIEQANYTKHKLRKKQTKHKLPKTQIFLPRFAFWILCFGMFVWFLGTVL